MPCVSNVLERRPGLRVAGLCVLCLVLAGCGSSGAMRNGASLRMDRGEASYYAGEFIGRPTASGEIYDPTAMTAAHRRLPFGTKVRVTRLDTKTSVVVRINDRGPFKRGRIIDLSRGAARKLDMLQDGVVEVHLEVVDALGTAERTASPPREGPTW